MDAYAPSRQKRMGVAARHSVKDRGLALSVADDIRLAASVALDADRHPDLVIAKRLLNHLKFRGFQFQRITPGEDGPLVGQRMRGAFWTWSISRDLATTVSHGESGYRR
jgi:hypothetical protein